ncbi:MAG: hypothetical protein ACT4ON_10100 [Bacteroidota bacterium]
MELYVHFILVNSEFNQGIANDLHAGQESEDNIKYLWEDELKVSGSITEFKIRNNAIYDLKGYTGEVPFDFAIPDMTICDCITTDGNKMQFAVSKKLLKKTEKTVNDAKTETHLYFYLKNTLPMENPMNGVYILNSDFPKALKKQIPPKMEGFI